jgi:parallel beta-helix repeat protein
VVNSNSDDGSTHTLRWAINGANADPDAQPEIDFVFATGQDRTIRLSSPLPYIMHSSVLIGGNSSGFAILDGTNAGGLNVGGLVIDDVMDCSINRLTIENFSGSGITIFGSGATGNQIGNFISGNVIDHNFEWGVLLQAGASQNVISGNEISGNGAGVEIVDGGTSHNRVQNNRIGITYDGSALGNVDGVVIKDGASSNLIGGLLDEGNVISGNTAHGVRILGAGTSMNHVDGNMIGTNANGSAPLGNRFDGVEIAAGASDNTIGEIGPDSNGNLISGNGQGVLLDGMGTSGNVLELNQIGIDATGQHAIPNTYGVVISGGASNNAVGVENFGGNSISGNAEAGIDITDPGTTRNKVERNFIGASTGDRTLGNGNGVVIENGATFNTIGVINEEHVFSNEISGNQNSAVEISGDSTICNFVWGNLIGTADFLDGPVLGNTYGVLLTVGANHNDVGDPTSVGTSQGGNIIRGNQVGVLIIRGAHDNTVGGLATGAGNEIAANVTVGVYILSGGNNTVEGNVIGGIDNPAGISSNAIGVLIAGGATNNTIGGTAAGAANHISGNQIVGIEITGLNADNNVVEGNEIGDERDDNPDKGNGTGVLINSGASYNTIGGTAAGAGNVISFNHLDGIDIQGSGTYFNVVQRNIIGGDSSGQQPFPNGGDGVRIDSGASGNTIGGLLGNIIAFNLGIGVDVRDSTSVANAIQANAIFNNGALGIDLGGDGVTPNTPGGPHTGPNSLQNYPTISAVDPNSGTVQFMLDSGTNNIYTIDFYANPAPDSSGHGQGRTWLGSMTVTTVNFPYTFTYTPVPGEPFITATATDFAGNTSEFSGAVAPPQLQDLNGSLAIALDNAQSFSLRRDPLMPRLLDVAFGGDAASAVSVDPSAFSQIVINGVTGNAIDLESVPAGVTVSVNAGAGTAVNISPAAQDLGTIQGSLNIVGDGDTALALDDQAATTSNTYILNATTFSRTKFGALSYRGLGSLAVDLAPGDPLPDYRSTQNIYVLGTPAGMTATINAANGWHDITVGLPTNPTLNTLGLPGSPLDNILGPVTVSGQAYQDVLALWDWDSSTAQKTYTINATSISPGVVGGARSAPISWQGNLSEVVLFGSWAADTFSLQSLPTDLAALAVDGGYTANTFQSLVPNPLTWAIYSNETVTTVPTPGHSVLLGEVYNLTGGPGGDDFQFLPNYGVDGKVDGVLDGKGGTLDYSHDASTITVDLANASASNLGGGAAEGFRNIHSVIGNNSSTNLVGPNTANYWNVTGNNQGNLSQTPNGTGSFTFRQIPTLTGGSADNHFRLSDGALVTGMLDGGGGNNTLDSSAYTTPLTWNLTGPNSGTSGGLSFQHIANVTGGSAGNRFVFQQAGSLSGILNGGGGTNTLDYSRYTGNITVDLALNLASLVNQGAAGSVFDFANVTGSIGNDVLVGDAKANVLIGGTGRNILIGHGGGDTLDAGRATSDNIVIGGWTAWDMSLAALNALFAEWTRTDLGFRDRRSDLLNGTNGQGLTPLNTVNGQLVLLTPATNPTSSNGTVHSDGVLDKLIGTNLADPATHKRAHNWFLYDALDMLLNYDPTSDAKNKVA